MDEVGAAIVKMLELYPNPDGPRPIANHPATMYAVTLTFHVSSDSSDQTGRHTKLTISDTQLDSSNRPPLHTLPGYPRALVGRPRRLRCSFGEPGVCGDISWWYLNPVRPRSTIVY